MKKNDKAISMNNNDFIQKLKAINMNDIVFVQK